ncbi:MAG TPA: hypothetical protein VG992_02955 [Candidatus Saccharimonadales bacterium]|nr:hypothetical protein [Candidatus Saccharimonadales bacterium]
MVTSKTPEESAEAALEHKVDAMMDPTVPDKPAALAPKASAKDVQTSDTDQPLDIFAGRSKPVSTAPELTGNAVEAGSEPSAEPAAETSVSEASSEESNSPEAVMDPAPENPVVEDAKTDAAIDDIMAHESDEVLAAQDARTRRAASVNSPRQQSRLQHLLQSRKTWLIIGLLIIILAAVPWTRYRLAGLVVHEQLTVTVLDSKTQTPVSNAIVDFNGHGALTNANGVARFQVPVGSGQLTVLKQYYQQTSHHITVGFHQPAPEQLSLVATGRQVSFQVVNSISGEPLADAVIDVLNTSAKTNQQGQSTVVLPADAVSDSAVVTAPGFNQTKVTLAVATKTVQAQPNVFKLTPAGKLYFLSNASGKIDVVKTNLDGSDRQTVLAGTGKEDPYSTTLLASRDWQYLVLEAQRSHRPALYLINIATNKVTEFDSSDATITSLGWSGHYFLYDLVSNAVPQSQAGHELVKSYNAETGQLNQLDASTISGSSQAYAAQSFGNFYILNGMVTYTTEWYGYTQNGGTYDLTKLSDTIRGVQANGQAKTDYQHISAADTGYIQAALTKPQLVNYAVYNSSTNQTSYYSFNGADQTAQKVSGIDQSTFYQSAPTYLVSPSSNLTFWSELRDGKNSLFVGDPQATNAQNLPSDGSYSPYGWYTDQYVLLTKNSSELYIMSASKTAKTPIKVGDYYKPNQNFAGYGYGYGGL